MSARAWSGSARHIPRRCAAATRSTKAPASGSSSARASSTPAPPPRRSRRSDCSCTVAAATALPRTSPTTPSRREHRRRSAHRRYPGGAAARPRDRGFSPRSRAPVPPSAEALETARAVDPAAAEILEPLLATTLSPTMISASDPSATSSPASATSPWTADSSRATLPNGSKRALRGGLALTSTTLPAWRTPQGGTRSLLDTPLWSAIETFVGHMEPGAAVAPFCVAGFTDSHWLRQAFGATAYGFFPMKEMEADLASRLVHSADERITDADLEARGRVPPSCCAGYRPIALMPMAEEKLRLGGMALANGVLVHGPTSWAAAVRTEGGEIEVASGRKRLLPWNGPVVRGPARLLEALLVLPRVRRTSTRRASRSSARRFSRRWRPRESAAEPSARPPASGIAGAGRRTLALAPALLAPRARPRRLPRRRACLHRHVRARRAGGEGARALRHAPRGPLLLAGRGRDPGGQGARVGPQAGQSRRRAPGRWPPRPRSSAGWCATPSIRSPGRCHGPARGSRRVATAEPSPEQVEVAQTRPPRLPRAERN